MTQQQRAYLVRPFDECPDDDFFVDVIHADSPKKAIAKVWRRSIWGGEYTDLRAKRLPGLDNLVINDHPVARGLGGVR